MKNASRFERFLANWKVSDRTLLELRYMERLSLVEIADRLGIGSSAVKMRHLRALKRFRALLEGARSESDS